MTCVLRTGGRLSLAVWAELAKAPGYASMIALLQLLFGDQIANELRAPFALGDRKLLASLAVSAGIADPKVSTTKGTVRFPSLEAWISTDVKGWTLADLIDDAQYDSLLRAAQQRLTTYVQEDGTVAFFMFGAPSLRHKVAVRPQPKPYITSDLEVTDAASQSPPPQAGAPTTCRCIEPRPK
jgi:hypothetical protein